MANRTLSYFNATLHALILVCIAPFVYAETAVKFDNESSYAEINAWQPSGDYKIIAWLGEAPTEESGRQYLLSNSDNNDFIAIGHNFVKAQFDWNWSGSWGLLNIAQTRYVEIIVEDGKMTMSDGNNTSYVEHDSITPQGRSYNWINRRDDEYSNGSLQGLALIDLNDHSNSRNIGFDDDGTPKVVSENDQAYLILHNTNTLITDLDVPQPSFVNVSSVEELALKIEQRYDGMPMLDADDNTGEDYAWEGHYWLRTYLHFYRVTGDEKYLQWAIELANKTFYDTDQMRTLRNGVSENDYTLAPKYLLNDRSLVAPGWKRPYGGSSVSVLIDGMTLSAIMRLVDEIKSNANLDQYQSIADQYIDTAMEIVASHNSSYSETKRAGVAGSWYYVNPDNTHENDDGIYSVPLAYNHSMAMATTLVYLDKWLGGVDEYQAKIDNIIEFFLDGLRFNENGTCDWDYNFHYTEDLVRVEDVNHGHIDIGFLVVADEEGYFEDNAVMQCLASTASQNIAIGPGPLPAYVNGSGLGIYHEQIAFSYDWIDLAKYDDTIPARAINILRAYPDLNWFRQYAALALQLQT